MTWWIPLRAACGCRKSHGGANRSISHLNIQKMMGHEEFQTTYRYMSLDEDVLREAQRAHERLILRA